MKSVLTVQFLPKEELWKLYKLLLKGSVAASVIYGCLLGVLAFSQHTPAHDFYNTIALLAALCVIGPIGLIIWLYALTFLVIVISRFFVKPTNAQILKESPDIEVEHSQISNADADKAFKAGCGALQATWFGGFFGFIIFTLLQAPYYFGLATGWILGFLFYRWRHK